MRRVAIYAGSFKHLGESCTFGYYSEYHKDIHGHNVHVYVIGLKAIKINMEVMDEKSNRVYIIVGLPKFNEDVVTYLYMHLLITCT